MRTTRCHASSIFYFSPHGRLQPCCSYFRPLTLSSRHSTDRDVTLIRYLPAEGVQTCKKLLPGGFSLDGGLPAVHAESFKERIVVLMLVAVSPIMRFRSVREEERGSLFLLLSVP